MSYFKDVQDFHEKFGVPHYPDNVVRPLTTYEAKFRIRFLIEELAEFLDACGFVPQGATLRVICSAMAESPVEPIEEFDVPGAADALADLVYVALGTAHFMGLPFDEVWHEVQRANMDKVRATGADDPRSKRAHALDVVKPEGWRPPDHGPALERAAKR